MVNSMPTMMPNTKRTKNQAQMLGNSLNAASDRTSRPTATKAMVFEPKRPMMRGRSGPASRMPMGPMAALTPMSQAGVPWRSNNSGRSCSTRPVAMSQQATVATAATRFPHWVPWFVIPALNS